MSQTVRADRREPRENLARGNVITELVGIQVSDHTGPCEGCGGPTRYFYSRGLRGPGWWCCGGSHCIIH